jgi:hypothetical protein
LENETLKIKMGRALDPNVSVWELMSKMSTVVIGIVFLKAIDIL